MPINFPSSPVVNQYFTSDGTTWIWDGSTWNLYLSPYGIYQSTAPTGTVAGQIWVDSDDNLIYVWDGANWDQAGPNLSAYAPLASPTFTGQVKLASGSASLPSISPSGDTNTGIFFPDADTIAFVEGGSEAMRIDSSGRVYIPNQPTFFASPTNTAGSGVATTFGNLSNNGFTIVSSSRITVPITGAYFISFTTISNNSSVRVDANIWLNGAEFVNMLSEDSTAGYHYRSASVVRRLSANDYIQFNNNNWYNATNTGVESWRTCSIIFLG